MLAAGITIFENIYKAICILSKYCITVGEKNYPELQFPASVIHYQLELINFPAIVENTLSTKAEKRKLLNKRDINSSP